MSSSVFHDDDEFYEYNPHPYKGGYDIALTYGQPLPPSPSTCYPLSHSPTPPSPKSLILQPPIPTSPLQSSSDYGQSGHRPVSTSIYDDLFGFWPLSAEESRRCGADVEVEGYWNQLKRAGDYLFGYSEGYGERRVGENSYGVPVYANMMEGCPSISCQLEPSRDYKVDYVDDNMSLLSEDTNYKSYDCVYNEHYYEQPIHVVEKSNEVDLQLNLTYHEVHEDIVEDTCTKMKWMSLFSEDTYYKSYDCVYNEQSYEQPIHVVEKSNEVDLQLNLTYHEVHEDIVEDTCTKMKWWDSYYEGDNNYCAYGDHEYEMPLYVDQNLIEPTLYLQCSYPEVYEMQVHPELEWWSSFSNELETQRCSYAYNKHHYQETLHAEEKFFEPIYQQFTYEEQIFSNQEMTPYLENTDNSYLSGNKQHNAEDHNHVELEPYKPTWSQYLYHPEIYVGHPCPEFNYFITDD